MTSRVKLIHKKEMETKVIKRMKIKENKNRIIRKEMDNSKNKAEEKEDNQIMIKKRLQKKENRKKLQKKENRKSLENNKKRKRLIKNNKS